MHKHEFVQSKRYSEKGGLKVFALVPLKLEVIALKICAFRACILPIGCASIVTALN